MLRKLANRLRAQNKRKRKKKVDLPRENILPPREYLPPRMSYSEQALVSKFKKVAEVPRDLFRLIDEDAKQGYLSTKTINYLKDLFSKGQQKVIDWLLNNPDFLEYVLELRAEVYDDTSVDGVGYAVECFLEDYYQETIFDDEYIGDYMSKKGFSNEEILNLYKLFSKYSFYANKFDYEYTRGSRVEREYDDILIRERKERRYEEEEIW